MVALLERGESVNAEDERHQTPLHVAAQGGRAGMTRLLLQRGPMPTNVMQQDGLHSF